MISKKELTRSKSRSPKPLLNMTKKNYKNDLVVSLAESLSSKSEEPQKLKYKNSKTESRMHYVLHVLQVMKVLCQVEELLFFMLVKSLIL